MALTFPILVLCGILIVFCRAVAFEASPWIAMSLAFLPILLSSGILLALGVLLIRIHMHEVKSLHLSFRRLIAGSVDLIMGFNDPLIRGMALFHCYLLSHEDKGMTAKIEFE